MKDFRRVGNPLPTIISLQSIRVGTECPPLTANAMLGGHSELVVIV